MGFIRNLFQDDYTKTQIETIPTVHEQDDGIILACCATGTSSRDSLVSWVKFLEEANPRLGKDIAILFTLKSPIGPTDNLDLQITDGKKKNENDEPIEFLTTDKNNNTKRVYNRLGNLGEEFEFEFGLDPSAPRLNQIGIGKISDTKFVNWPHHYNQETIEHLNKIPNTQTQPQPISTDSKSRREKAQLLKEEIAEVSKLKES